MKTFKQHITEAFDKPYPLDIDDGGTPDRYKVKFKVDSKISYRIVFGYDAFSGDDSVEVSFWPMGSGAGMTNSDFKKTGTGNEFRVFATVMDAIKKYVKEYEPEQITFSGDKGEESRVRLYKTMVKRFAGQNGYKLTKVGDINIPKIGMQTEFTIERK